MRTVCAADAIVSQPTTNGKTQAFRTSPNIFEAFERLWVETLEAELAIALAGGGIATKLLLVGVPLLALGGLLFWRRRARSKAAGGNVENKS